MTAGPEVDFNRIIAHRGSQASAFEELCCQLAHAVEGVTNHAEFQRNGPGADLGVECLWTHPDGAKWGWQAKYVFDVLALKRQVDESLQAALAQHTTLTRYVVCFPFDPSAAKGRGQGKSQWDKLKAYKAAWEAKAATAGVRLTIEYWPAHQLESRLVDMDAHGGRRLYWFGEPVLTDEWFARHLARAIAQAGPRYTPELTVGHPLQSSLAALTHTKEWEGRLEEWRTKLSDLHDTWSKSVSAAQPDRSVPPLPNQGARTAADLQARLATLRSLVPAAVATQAADLLALGTEAKAATSAAEATIAVLRDDLETRFGRGSADSKQFRSFHAEYQVSFPAAHYDRAVDVRTTLLELCEWLELPDLRASASQVLLITGAAGVGKTHSLCDEARGRRDAGLFSLLLFGAAFGNAPVWDQIRTQLGLGAEWNMEALLDGLCAAAETSGRTLLICIDALNETNPRNYWLGTLRSLLHVLGSRPQLRLCVSCRTGYTASVLDRDLDIPQLEHRGFEGVITEACDRFFEHYGLTPPTGPLLDPEFENPLFLKVVCRALQASGRTALPPGWTGFRAALRALLQERDAELEQAHGSSARSAVTRSLEAVAQAMAATNTRSLTHTETMAALGQVTCGPLSPGERLQRLLDDELLMLTPRSGTPGLLSDHEEAVSFAFERLGDHLIVQVRLSSLSPSDSLPDSLLDLATSEPGIAEALAVQWAELRGAELLDIVDGAKSDKLYPSWLHALRWRAPATITTRSGELLLGALSRQELVEAGMDTLVLLACRPGHTLDWRWLHQTLTRVPMSRRDGRWCPYLHFSWSAGVSRSPVRRIVEASKSVALERVGSDARLAWLITLCWFTLASDRRVRDEATRAAVRVAQQEPATWATVCEHMLDVDDDYVVERVLAAAYGTLLRRQDDTEAMSQVVSALERKLVEQARPPNALIRDLARCIAELAHRQGATVNIDRLRQPGKAEWPLTIPSQAEVDEYKDRSDEYPRLWSSLDRRFHGDFAIYTVSSALRPYAHAFDIDAGCRWLLGHVADLGYEPRVHGRFDGYLVHTHGGGRSRAGWAERIGKKYQWIALHRLVAHVGDNVTPKADGYETSPDAPAPSQLPGQKLRDLDPGVVSPPHEQQLSKAHDLMTGRPADDEEWTADDAEVLELESQLWSCEFGGSDDWLPLEAHVSYTDGRTRDGDIGFRRQIWLQVRSYLVPVGSFERLWRWASKQHFMGRWLPEGYRIGDGVYFGEYPWAVSLGPRGLVDTLPEAGLREQKLPAALLPTCHTLLREFPEDSSEVEQSSVLVPIPQLVHGHRWDGEGGFVDDAAQLCFVDPSFSSGGASRCLARREPLLRWLEAAGMSVLWTVLSEKLPGDYENVQRLEYSRVRGLHKGKLCVARSPVLKR